MRRAATGAACRRRCLGQAFDVDLPDLYMVYHSGYVAIEAAAHFQGQYGRTKVIYTLIGENSAPSTRRRCRRGLTPTPSIQGAARRQV